MTTVLGVVFLLDFTVFVYKRCHPPVKEEDEEDEDETDEGETKQVPPSDKTAMIDLFTLIIYQYLVRKLTKFNYAFFFILHRLRIGRRYVLWKIIL